MSFSKKLKWGFIVGALDITAAFIQYYLERHKSPVNVLYYIASSVLGEKAFEEGTFAALIGLVLHFCVAIIFTFLFFFIFPFLKKFFRHNVVIAILYAAAMWSIMQYIILPLFKVPLSSLSIAFAVGNIAILCLCISLPLSIVASKK